MKDECSLIEIIILVRNFSTVLFKLFRGKTHVNLGEIITQIYERLSEIAVEINLDLDIEEYQKREFNFLLVNNFSTYEIKNMIDTIYFILRKKKISAEVKKKLTEIIVILDTIDNFGFSRFLNPRNIES